jgi:hypothetical protein
LESLEDLSIAGCAAVLRRARDEGEAKRGRDFFLH